MCLFSGGSYKHNESTKNDVAKANIEGLLNHIINNGTFVRRIEFAYDDDVFKWVLDDFT